MKPIIPIITTIIIIVCTILLSPYVPENRRWIWYITCFIIGYFIAKIFRNVTDKNK